jgi:hypothetical protein
VKTRQANNHRQQASDRERRFKPVSAESNGAAKRIRRGDVSVRGP